MNTLRFQPFFRAEVMEMHNQGADDKQRMSPFTSASSRVGCECVLPISEAFEERSDQNFEPITGAASVNR